MAFFMVEEMRTILFFSENKRIERKWYLVYNMFKICFWECYNLLFLEIFFFVFFKTLRIPKINMLIPSSLSLSLDGSISKKEKSFIFDTKEAQIFYVALVSQRLKLSSTKHIKIRKALFTFLSVWLLKKLEGKKKGDKKKKAKFWHIL